jgi:hypothetical protein
MCIRDVHKLIIFWVYQRNDPDDPPDLVIGGERTYRYSRCHNINDETRFIVFSF